MESNKKLNWFTRLFRKNKLGNSSKNSSVRRYSKSSVSLDNEPENEKIENITLKSGAINDQETKSLDCLFFEDRNDSMKSTESGKDKDNTNYQQYITAYNKISDCKSLKEGDVNSVQKLSYKDKLCIEVSDHDNLKIEMVANEQKVTESGDTSPKFMLRQFSGRNLSENHYSNNPDVQQDYQTPDSGMSLSTNSLLSTSWNHFLSNSSVHHSYDEMFSDLEHSENAGSNGLDTSDSNSHVLLDTSGSKARIQASKQRGRKPISQKGILSFFDLNNSDLKVTNVQESVVLVQKIFTSPCPNVPEPISRPTNSKKNSKPEIIPIKCEEFCIEISDKEKRKTLPPSAFINSIKNDKSFESRISPVIGISHQLESQNVLDKARKSLRPTQATNFENDKSDLENQINNSIIYEDKNCECPEISISQLPRSSVNEMIRKFQQNLQ